MPSTCGGSRATSSTGPLSQANKDQAEAGNASGHGERAGFHFDAGGGSGVAAGFCRPSRGQRDKGEIGAHFEQFDDPAGQESVRSRGP